MNITLPILLIFCAFLASAQQTEKPNPTQEPALAAAVDLSPASSPATFEESFQQGTQLYQAKKYEEATKAFQRATELQPSNVTALTNLALANFNSGHKPLAVALLRRALALDPNFSTPAAGLRFILPQLEVKEIPHEIQLKETLRQRLLVPVPWSGYLTLTALFLFSGGWLLLSWWGLRRRALKNELPLPAFPVIGILFSVAFLLTSTLSIAKFLDYQVPRGTVIQDKVMVMSAPDAKSAGLFELFGGLEVILETTKDDWVQVTYPGALSGWISKSAIYPTSGKKLW